MSCLFLYTYGMQIKYIFFLPLSLGLIFFLGFFLQTRRLSLLESCYFTEIYSETLRITTSETEVSPNILPLTKYKCKNLEF